MTSWRDTASPQTQQSLDELLNRALEAALGLLSRSGEFYPYAATLDLASRPSMTAIWAGEEDPPSGDVFAQTVQALLAGRDELAATALVADVRLGSSDAVRIELEHRAGIAVTVLQPYRRTESGNLDYGPLRAAEGARRIWPGGQVDH